MASHDQLVAWCLEQFPAIPNRFMKRGDSFIDRLAIYMLALGGCDNDRIAALKEGLWSLATVAPIVTSCVRRIDDWLNPNNCHGEDFSKLLFALLGGAFSTSGAAAIGRGEFLFWLTCPAGSPGQADFHDQAGRTFNLKTLKACIAPGRNTERGTVAIDRINADTWGAGLIPGQKKTFERWSALAMQNPTRLQSYLREIFPHWPMPDIDALAATADDYERFNLTHGLLCMRNGAAAAGLHGYIMIDAEAFEAISLLSEDFTEDAARRFRLRFRSHLSRRKDTNSTPEGYTVIDRAVKRRA